MSTKRDRMIKHINRANRLIAELHQHMGALNYYLRSGDPPPFGESETRKFMTRCLQINDEAEEWYENKEQ